MFPLLRRARVSIRMKLALLAGVPVIGALLLAMFVANDARKGAASAASLGSIEDLAQLTAYITEVLHAVEDERAVDAIAEGDEGAPTTSFAASRKRAIGAAARSPSSTGSSSPPRTLSAEIRRATTAAR